MWLAVIAIVLYLILDLIYISMTKNVYADAVQMVSGRTMNVGWPFAVGAYTVMMVGWWVLVGSRIQVESTWSEVLFWGAIFGLCVYGTFNFTVGAMFEKYRGHVVLQDICWGIIGSTVISAGYFAALQYGAPHLH